MTKDNIEEDVTRKIGGKTYTMKTKKRGIAKFLDKLSMKKRSYHNNDKGGKSNKEVEDMTPDEYDAYLRSILSPEVYDKQVKQKGYRKAVREDFDKGSKVTVKNKFDEMDGESGVVNNTKGEVVEVKFNNGSIVEFNEDELMGEDYTLVLDDGTVAELSLDEIKMINHLSENLNEENRADLEARAMSSEAGLISVIEFAEEVTQ